MKKNDGIQRVKTGLQDLDKLLDGGFPKNSIILVTGPPGSGKTIMGVEFLYRGAIEYSDSGYFISLEMQKDEIYLQAKQMGWDMKKIENMVSVVFIESKYQISGSNIFGPLINNIKASGAKRVVLDSLNSFVDFYIPKIIKAQPYLGNVGSSAITRYAVFYLIEELRKIDATIILISDASSEKDSRNYSSNGVSEYLCDGIINLNYLNMGGAQSRTLEIPKMRLTAQEKDFIPYDITDKGIVLNLKDRSSVMMK
ncbi:MAG: ATPase domain-containing protein [archaeon]|nr:ATPase domain-containing protein [archaeon]